MFFIVFLVFCGHSTVPAETIVVDDSTPSLTIGPQVEFLEDTSGTYGIYDVLAKPESDWENCSSETINFGYTNSAYWLKLSFKNIRNAPVRRLIEIAYPVLDYIDLFYTKRQKVNKSFKMGDKYPFEKRGIKHRNYIIPLELKPYETTDLVIRVQTNSSMQIPIFMETEYELLEKSQSRLLEFGFYYGIMLVMAVYNLFVFISVREKTYLYYVVYVSAMCLFVASLNGISYQYIWPSSIWWNDQTIIVSLAGVLLFALLFSRNFLNLAASSPRVDRLAGHMILYHFIFLIISFNIQYRYAIILVIVNSVIVIFSIFCIGIYRLKKNSLSAKFFLTAWGALFFGGLILAFNKLGFLARNAFTENALQFGSAAEVVLLSIALAERLNSEKKERYEAQQISLENEKRANSAQNKSLQHEKEAREAHELALLTQKKANETLEKNVYLRTKELEQANAKLKDLSITDGLTKLNNRRYFNEIYPNEFMRAFREKTPLSFLIIDIDHFKQFNDQFGHLTGDDCLKTVAQAIKSRLQRDNDFIARYGGEEFCVLLPNTKEEGAVRVAESIREHIQDLLFQVNGEKIQITVSIGISTEIPVDKSEANRLLSMADKALYQSKADGRNRITLHKNA